LGLRKFFPNVPDMAACIGKSERKWTETERERIESVLVEIRALRLRGTQISA
jgi:hypothetical protein